MNIQLPVLRFELLMFVLISMLSGCGFLNRGGNYADSGSTNPLEAPPDLVTPEWADSLEIPKTANDRISALETQGPALGAAVLPEFVDVRVRREGPTRWLEVDTDPVTLWPLLRKFIQDENFDIAADEPVLGYIETEWKQNLGRSVSTENQQDSYDVTGEKFRIRLERQPNAVTNIFLTQRGAEVAAINKENQILWKPQPPNGEREAEMMIRLMEFLGSSREDAQYKFANADAQFLYLDIKDIGGVPVLMVGDVYSRVWRRTGVALDRSGLLVEDHNRNKGVYYVALDLAPTEVSVQSVETKKTFYQIHLLRQGKQTLITAHEVDKEAGIISPEMARQLLRRIVAAYPGSYPNA
ncbi:MAG: outer membrane protein assembly factor BamC [Gammaproteobacteria bacterium]|nr:outer membrane protein assembly factor BamC [Gammaproteobacteria bacterium]